MSDTAIGDHALLSDRHGAALVDRGGSVEWWCPPRFDAPSVFARLVDGNGGHFAVRPTGLTRVERAYLPGTLVLRTTMHTATGTLQLTDALAFAAGARSHEIGADSPQVLLRRAVCTHGHVDVDVDFAPRFEYALSTPLMIPADGGLIARGGASSLRVSSDLPLQLDGATARARAPLQAGGSLSFAVEHLSSWRTTPKPWTAQQISDRLEDTAAGWRSWQDDHDRYDGPYTDLVRFSGRVLHALAYQPTGAVVAAPTTSLPEVIGGDRNWDYRYSWVRDASLALNALWVAACPDEAAAFMRYLTTAASPTPQTRDLQIVFGVGGERDLSERQLPHLAGWRGSRPVRIGNGAWDQRQLDVYGELLAAADRLSDQLRGLQAPERRFLASLADAAAQRWTEPDRGIWELRGPPRHHVYSKIMCWVALDCAIAVADQLEVTDRIADWKAARDDIRAAILDRGWNDRVGAFTDVFDSDHLDASALRIPIVGFLPATDERVTATIDAIERDLTDDKGLVYRYRRDDCLPGDEGAFLICTFWLAQALARSGQPQRARAVFERAIAARNDLDLLAEEVDASTGEPIGNFPQAFSHIGLINAAWEIGTAEGPSR